MTKGQLSHRADTLQEAVEDPLFDLGVSLALLEHDLLRIHQAIEARRAGDLLEPVVDDLDLVAKHIRGAQEFIREVWEKGQDSRWRLY